MPKPLWNPPAGSVCWREDSTSPPNMNFLSALGTAPLGGGLVGDKIVAVMGSCWSCPHTSQWRTWAVLHNWDGFICWVYGSAAFAAGAYAVCLNQHDSAVLMVMCRLGAGSKLTHGPYSGIVDQLVIATVLGAVQKKSSIDTPVHRKASLLVYACMFCF